MIIRPHHSSDRIPTAWIEWERQHRMRYEYEPDMRLKLWMEKNFPQTMNEVLVSAATVHDLQLDEIMTFVVPANQVEVEFDENNEITAISSKSPLGEAIVKHRVGETVKIRTPEVLAEYKILEKMKPNRRNVTVVRNNSRNR